MHTLQMTPRQLSFWQALLAPFHDHELSLVPARGSKKELTYLDKRALANRLDSVCGPHGWKTRYRATRRGYKCRLFLRCPDETESGWIWLSKENGAGFEEMGSYNKQTNEWEADVDNDEKSGYTNAFRRVGQDEWGIGRYLYRKGIPSFLDPKAKPPEPVGVSLVPASTQAADPHAAAHEAMSGPREPAAPPAPAQAPAPAPQPQPAPSNPAPAQPQGQRQYSDFKIPPPGKAVFSWTKRMEEHFETGLLEGMKREAERLGAGTTFAAWDKATVDDLCVKVIAYLKTLPHYKGEYDHVETPEHHDHIARQPDETQPAPTLVDEAALSSARREVSSAIVALLKVQLKRDPQAAECGQALKNIAPEVANGEGLKGEVPERLAGLSDIVWLRNMADYCRRQIELAKQAEQAAAITDDDIPF